MQSKLGEIFGKERGTCKGSLWELEDSDTSSALSLPYTQPSVLDFEHVGAGGHLFPFIASGLGTSMIYSEELINTYRMKSTLGKI